MDDSARTKHADGGGGVVLTGVGLCTSLGVDVETTWRAVLAGAVGIGPLTEVESPLPEGSVGGQALELPPDYRPELTREVRMLRWVVEQALANAGIDGGSRATGEADRRCAVLGTTLHGLRAGGRFLRSGNPGDLESFLAGATAAQALEGLGLEGGCATTCSACSSSLGAIALGVTMLESGRADVVVAGGYDAMSEYSWGGFNALRLITPTQIRPFCSGRQGMKVGEGFGVVVLETEARARARGATVIVHLAGWGESADAYHLTKPHPGGEGALSAMRMSLQRAGIAPQQLGMITAHATGTPDNDAGEYSAMSALLGPDLASVPVAAHKSRLGHTLGGAGVIELVLSAMAIRDQRVPGTANVSAGDIEFADLRVTTEPSTGCVIDHTLNTSLGFGGANTCVVLSRNRARDRQPDPPTRRGERACITGIGILLPGAVGLEAFAARLSGGSDVPPSSMLNDAVLAEFTSVRRARRMSPSVRFALAAAEMAFGDAALLDDPDRLSLASCLLGSMHGSAGFCYDYYSQIVREGVLAANPVLFAEGVPNAAAAHMSTTFKIRGGCQTIIGARTAGLDALALAGLRIETGASQIVLVVATEEQCEVVDRAYLTQGWPRASGGDGFERSHGAVAFVVESEASAAKRGADAWARLGDSASAFCGVGGVPRAVAAVLKRLAATGSIVGSAGGTWLDRAEAAGIRRADRGSEVVSTPVTAFGELFAATALVGVAQAVVKAGGPSGFTSLCTDWDGLVTAMNVERVERKEMRAGGMTE